MGVGKSTVGEYLARRINFNFVDLDREIELVVGKSIADIFREHGEGYFRKVEKDLLVEIARRRDGMVVATGGGTVEDEDNREILKKCGVTVWLNASIEELVKRGIIGDPNRPLTADLEVFLERYKRRIPFYREVAELRVDVNSKGVVEVVEEIWDYLKRRYQE